MRSAGGRGSGSGGGGSQGQETRVNCVRSGKRCAGGAVRAGRGGGTWGGGGLCGCIQVSRSGESGVAGSHGGALGSQKGLSGAWGRGTRAGAAVSG